MGIRTDLIVQITRESLRKRIERVCVCVWERESEREREKERERKKQAKFSIVNKNFSR